MSQLSTPCRKCFQPTDRITQESAISLQHAIRRWHQLYEANREPVMCQQTGGSHWVCHAENVQQNARPGIFERVAA